MDVNLTGQVAANLIQNPTMIVSASAIGGLVTGALTLLGVRITQKHDAERTMKERRTQAYANFLSSTFYIHSLFRLGEKPGKKDLKEWYKFTAEVKLLGSPKIIREIIIFNPNDLADRDKMISYGDKLVRLMAKELQGFDVYIESTQPSEQKQPFEAHE